MKKKLVVGAVCFLLAGGMSFLILYVVSGRAEFGGKGGEVTFAENIPETEAAELREAFTGIELARSVTIERHFADSPEEGGILADILVPMTDFYDTKNTITKNEFEKLFESGDSSIISIEKLDSSAKLLAVDGEYFLDSFSGGAKFKYFDVSGVNEEDVRKITEAVEDKFDKLREKMPSAENTLTLVQTGVTALARGMNAKLDEVGDAKYFSANLREFFSKYDFVHTSSESSLSDAATSENICSDPRFLDTFLDLSVDVVELTGNHNLDCGAEDALTTINVLDGNGILYFGGGKNLEDARRPLRLSSDEAGMGEFGITLLGYNESTGGATTGENPGANPYDEADARERIGAAKAAGDFVIVDIQYYECNEYANYEDATDCDYANSSAGDQIGLFRSLIEMGADVVVGTSAHQPQTFEKYQEGEIYYGLGNLLFDQSWWPGTTRSLGLVHYFWDGKLIQTRRFGTVYDAALQTRLMSEEEENNFIERLTNARPEQ